MSENRYELNKELAQMLKGGVIMDVTTPEQARIAQEAVTIPVMAKCRIGHFAEAQILEANEIDYIDESEVLSPADDVFHIDKTKFKVPFVCGAKDLGEALRRINEGASMIRTKGEPGTGDVVQAVRHMGNVKGVGEIPMTFIRAPYIEKCGNEVEVLSKVDERIVAARYRNQLGISFHPEVTHDTRMYKYFLEMIK